MRAARAARAAGVLQGAGTFGNIVRGSNGDVIAVTTTTGERVEGDLFIDCTGTRALLAEPATGAEWQDWTSWLPCDSLVSAVIGTGQAPVPYSHHEAFETGWIQHLPMQGMTCLHGLYRADEIGETQLLDKLIALSLEDHQKKQA